MIQKLFWSFRYPWPRSAIETRIRPLWISICPEERFSECVELHERNELHGVPSDHREHYLATLRSGEMLTLMAEENGRLVGTFGIQRTGERNIFFLCYVMACPNHHRRGVGTTMFLAALALLPKGQADLVLGISALPTAADFYYGLGFVRACDDPRSTGPAHQIAYMYVTSGMRRSCGEWLSKAGVILPDSGYEIPTVKADSYGELQEFE